MSFLASTLVASDASLPDLPVGYRPGAAGLVQTMAPAATDRWFAVDVLMIPVTRPVHWTERTIAAVSRALGPIALGMAVIVPVVALIR
jgi:hypothetical protein